MAHPIGPAGTPSATALAMAQPPGTFMDSEAATGSTAAASAAAGETLGQPLGRTLDRLSSTLHISESTVKFHVANILSKLEVGSRGEAAAMFHAAA
ncbi:LuxR C-terminal-related transcriptional regulator [Streptomyces sp. NPDC055134]